MTLDDQSPPSICASASTAYVKPAFLYPVWPAGESAGSVYRLDGSTGVITSCVQLPSSSNASLGNLLPTGWSNVLPEFEGTDPPINLTVDLAPGDTRQFFRVVEIEAAAP
ncbi:MAG: hypothetical protein O3A87_04640 [Verrucomicrobia bacterium]|nr:hypothetical protein [Verrucomicrobiota bacterium]MDA1005755.1 hypothetical protein [Verrucomicrobiota bacterium]